jgi:hypothetical protein
MAISLVFSSTNGGVGLGAPVDHGNIANGSSTSATTIYVRHNGINPITSVTLYCASVDTGEYTGDATAANDFAELLAWGNAAASGDFGGSQVNFNASASFPNSSWPTFANKSTVDGFGYTIRSGIGDSSGSGIAIPTATGATSLGTIQAGASPNVRFQMRVVVPQNEDTLGIRQFRTSFSFNYTS